MQTRIITDSLIKKFEREYEFYIIQNEIQNIKTSCIFLGFVLECTKEQMRTSAIRQKEDTYMAYVISDECVSCGACEAQCPVEAISEGAEHFEIDADTCLECGACADQCPVGAISAE